MSTYLEKQVESSIIQYLSTTLSSTVDWTEPFERDIDAEGVNEVIQIVVRDMEGLPSRSNAKQARVTVDVDVLSKSTTNVLKTSDLADEVSAALSNKTVNVYDYETVGEPQVGHIRFKELQSRRDDKPTWATKTCFIEGYYYGIV